MSNRTLLGLSARLALPSLFAVAVTLGGCSSNETGPGPDAHDPAYARLYVNGVDETDNLILAAGAVTRVQIRFYLADSTEETSIESSHFSSLTFTPTALATPASVTGHHWQWDVTGQATPGTGTVMVGFGHDALADEESFGPFPVTVQ